jgi:hypothetical protein
MESASPLLQSIKKARSCSCGIGEFLEIIKVLPIALLMNGAPALSQIPRLVKAIDKYSR